MYLQVAQFLSLQYALGSHCIGNHTECLTKAQKGSHKKPLERESLSLAYAHSLIPDAGKRGEALTGPRSHRVACSIPQEHHRS